mmetsp:Transcript_37772/g.119326  ORF Transcript_37772/g.119326 Transcript_37772/m.119326 type:complete len:86 (+) Transcript_37772:113-370(+)
MIRGYVCQAHGRRQHAIVMRLEMFVPNKQSSWSFVNGVRSRFCVIVWSKSLMSMGVFDIRNKVRRLQCLRARMYWCCIACFREER